MPVLAASGVGVTVILQKLGPFLMRLNTHLAQKSEMLRKDQEGRAITGLAAASHQEVSQQISNNVYKPQSGCFPSAL